MKVNTENSVDESSIANTEHSSYERDESPRPAPQTIVLAKVEMTGMEFTDKYERFDGVNYRRCARPAPEAKAMTWLLEGSAADVRRARQFADTEGYTVFTYAVDEPDPLGQAKSSVIQLVSGQKG